MDWNETNLRLIETGVLLLLSVSMRRGIGAIIDRTSTKFAYHMPRARVIKRIINFVLVLLMIGILLMIWGVKQSDLLFFISSALTVIGVAFFAQWSVLSNITSSIIIFFNYPMKIGDHITILEKDHEVEGRIIDIAIFYVVLETDKREKITIPSNVFMQKIVRKDNSHDPVHHSDDSSEAV
jgi:small-conductance mechanosensitive channel